MKRLLVSVLAILGLLALPTIALADAYIHATGGLAIFRTEGACSKQGTTTLRCSPGYGKTAHVTFRPSWESKSCHDPRASCCGMTLENQGHTFSGDKWTMYASNSPAVRYNCTYNWRGSPNTVYIAPPR